MRIQSAELRHLRMRLKAPFETSFGVELDRDCLVLCLEADGLRGWGECVADRNPGYCYETTGTAWHVLTEFMLPAVLGRELGGPGELRAALRGIRGHPLARAAIEMALWDLQGRAQGTSLARLFGGRGGRVEVGVSVGIQKDVPQLLRVVDNYRKDGYTRVKLKIKPGRDLIEVGAVREAFPDLRLQVDANSAYSLEDTRVFREMDSLGLLLIEQPLAEDDLIDHARLQAQLQTPLCLDESILSARHARQALEIEACRVINIKPARVGGYAEAIAVHDICRERGVPVWCGGMLETGIGRAANLALASLPGFTLPGDISATDRYYETDIARPRFSLNADSTISVPDGPGLGVEIDPAALDGFTLRKTELSAAPA
jgi:o-succinylbenzoate synthase